MTCTAQAYVRVVCCQFFVGQATSPICRAIASRTAGDRDQGIVLGALGIAETVASVFSPLMMNTIYTGA